MLFEKTSLILDLSHVIYPVSLFLNNIIKIIVQKLNAVSVILFPQDMRPKIPEMEENGYYPILINTF